MSFHTEARALWSTNSLNYLGLGLSLSQAPSHSLTESVSLTRSVGQLLSELPYGGTSPLAN